MYTHNFTVYFTELNMEVEPKPLFRTKMFSFLLQNINLALIAENFWEPHGSTWKIWD